MENDCPFCKIVKKELPAEIVAENNDFLVIKDIDQSIPGHSLVIPKGHYETFETLPEEFYEGFYKITREAIMRLKAETNMKGYNLIMNNYKIAGQVVPHMHLHIIPRKEKDSVHVME